MSKFGGALLRAWLIASVPVTAMAQTPGEAPLIVEAEDGVLGSSLAIATDSAGVTHISVVPEGNSAAMPTPDRVATYTVMFPAPGNYALYVRILTGPVGGADDSFYWGNGFGTTTNWSGPYNTSNGGATAPASGVSTGGSAGQNVWKWVRITPISGIPGGFNPNPWVVPEGALTQTFAWGSREDGLLFDKFAFAPVESCYTVGDLDAPRPSTVACPTPQVTPPAFTRAGAPLATGDAKYLGSAHSPWSGNPNTPNPSLNFGNYWNQVTPENGGKWGSVEGTRDVYNFTAAHAAEAQAIAVGGVFKWHVLFWGNQQPQWMWNLTPAEQLEEIHEWLNAIRTEFPNLQEIEVVNEPLHDPPDKVSAGNTNATGGSGGYYEALGGAGATGHDWIVTAFTLARQYFPNAKLMLNDYSITNDGNATTRYLEIIDLLKARGLIDLVGIQGHAFEFNYNNLAGSAATHRANLTRLQATGLPVYVTEFDIDGAESIWNLPDDASQLRRFQALFPVFWEHEAVKGVTLWGYMQGAHWRTGQGAWLMYQNGAERPALQWLVQYMEDQAPVVNAGQTFSVAENATETPEVAEAIQALLDRGYSVNSDTVTTMMLMIGNPQGITALNPVTNQVEFFPGGANNYDESSLQFLVWSRWGAATVGPQLGKLIAIDADSGQTLSDWRIEEGGGWFNLDAKTGQLAQKPFPPLDFDTSYNVFDIKVTVSDGFKRSAPQTVRVKLTNVNDNAPEITAGQSYRIDGGRNNTVAQVNATDADDTSQPGFTAFSGWAITSGNTNNVFRLNGTGHLQVNRPLLVDWRKSSYTLGTSVRDGANTSPVQAVQVTIPNRVNLCLLDAIRLEAPKASAPLLILLGADIGSCR
jgi:endo-1,4-beta-xylanase